MRLRAVAKTHHWLQFSPVTIRELLRTRGLGAAALVAGLLASGCGLIGNEGERQAAVVKGICLDCHNATEQVAGLNLEALPFDSIGAHAETWEMVIRKLRAGLMPPADGGPTLERDAREGLASWREDQTDQRARTRVEYGRGAEL